MKSWHEGQENKPKYQCVKLYEYFNSLKITWETHLLKMTRNIHSSKNGFIFINEYLTKALNLYFPEDLL